MRKLFTFLIMGLLSLPAFAQNTGLGVGPGGLSVTLNSQPVFGDTIAVTDSDILLYTLNIINNGNVSVTDQFGLGISRFDSLSTGLDTLYPGFVRSDTLNPGDTINITVQDSIDTSAARYGGGGGIVVITIWPAARTTVNPLPPDDSAFISIDIQTTAIDDEWKERGLFVLAFPNPTREQLFIQYGDLKPEIEYVRMLDSQGRELQRYEYAVEELSLGNLPAGVYHLVLQGEGNKRASLQIVKHK